MEKVCEWLPVVFGGNAPEFADEAEAKAILGALWAATMRVSRALKPNALRERSASPVLTRLRSQ
jgi:hypothetical protein